MSTSTQKVKANRRNAKRSTGPATAEGKAIVAGNALRHGMRSAAPIVPAFEREEEWQQHRDAVTADLAPVGYVESALTEQVALAFWRMRRATRYETEVAAVGLELAEQSWAQDRNPDWKWDRATPLRKAEEAVAAAQAEAELVGGVGDMPPGERIDVKLAARIVEEAAHAAGVNIYSDLEDGRPEVELPEYPDGKDLDDVPWDAGHFVMALEAIGKGGGFGEGELLEALRHAAREKLTREEAKRDALAAELDLYRRRLSLPPAETLDKVRRYETGLERSMYKALHELQRMQAARNGHPVAPPAVVDVHGMDGVEGQN